MQLSRFALQVSVALWLSTFCNGSSIIAFWKTAPSDSPMGTFSYVFAGLLFLFLVCLLLTLLVSAPFRGRWIRLPLAVLLMSAAALSFFTLTLGMHFDRTMLQNLLQTDVAESADLITGRLIIWLALVGVLPCVLITKVRLAETKKPYWRQVGFVALVIGVTTLMVSVLVYSQYARFASAVRNHALSHHKLAPLNFVTATFSHLYTNRLAKIERTARGRDAAQKYLLKKPRLVVFLLGETTRAQNFGLNGYERDTTPQIRALDPLYFANTTSCGTTTAESVPCIFSGLSKAGYSASAARSQETLVDVVRHAGVPVWWRDNDGGCKDVCANAVVEDLNDAVSTTLCPERGNCYDEILLQGLKEKIESNQGDLFIVLHLKGSHGPAYFKRYPPAFERFFPACQSIDLASCSAEQIRNAYDNTIVYGDHVMTQTTKLLQSLSNAYATALLYVSDHGESLGENGMYLHGLPYAMAPETQTRVPMLAWLSPEFISLEKWDTTCLRQATSIRRSHDNVYHTILGLLDIETREYNRALDIFGECDRGRQTAVNK